MNLRTWWAAVPAGNIRNTDLRTWIMLNCNLVASRESMWCSHFVLALNWGLSLWAHTSGIRALFVLVFGTAELQKKDFCKLKCNLVGYIKSVVLAFPARISCSHWIGVCLYEHILRAYDNFHALWDNLNIFMWQVAVHTSDRPRISRRQHRAFFNNNLSR